MWGGGVEVGSSKRAETPAELTEAPEKYGDSCVHKAAGLMPLNLLGPQPASVLEGTVEACAPERAATCLGRSWRAHIVWLLDVVIDLDHVLMVTKRLDEMGGLLQVRVSQLHLCVGDEL